MRQQLGKMKSDGIEARRVIKQKLGKPCGNSIIIEWPIKKGGEEGISTDPFHRRPRMKNSKLSRPIPPSLYKTIKTNYNFESYSFSFLHDRVRKLRFLAESSNSLTRASTYPGR